MILPSQNNQTTKYEPNEQLEYLRLQCNSLKKDLYKTNALYLNLTRDILPNSIRHAVFLLITDNSEYQLNFSSPESRKICFEKIDKIASKYNSFLTIEHLMNIAEEIEKEKQEDQLNKNKEFLSDKVQSSENKSSKLDLTNIDSIDLSSKPPIENTKLIYQNFKGKILSSSDDLNFELLNKQENISNNAENDNSNLGFKSIQDQHSNNLPHNKNEGITVFKKLLMMAGDIINKEKTSEDNQESPYLNNKSQQEEHDSADIFLPETPIELYYWMNSIEIAFDRILRDLSNSINIELLRSGLINNLMPVKLLDAAISGELDSEDSHSNLLKLKVPLGNSSPNENMHMSCLLVRATDLEFDNPRLKKYKSYLIQRRNLLVTMVKKQRHWQNRSLANEVNQQWLKTPLGKTKTDSL